MFVARWSVDIKFGHKDATLAVMKKWQEEVGSKVGIQPQNTRILSGSLGAPESRIENEIEIGTLAELESAFEKFPLYPYHKQFAQDIEQHIVSGSNKWEVYRLLPM